MAIRRILLLGDPLLRAVSRPVPDGTSAGPALEDLRDTLHEFQRTHVFGRGISAVQIGRLERVIYIEFEGRELSLVNPAYEYQSEAKFQLWDDCFSFPDLLVRVERAETVALRFTRGDGKEERLAASGALSELIQHEMDHLDGVLAIDRAIGPEGWCVREEWLRRYARQGSAPAMRFGTSNRQ